MSVNVSVDDANTCGRKLLEGAIDFAVCGEPELILENYFDPFFHDSLNVIVSDRHPLAAKASINLEDLENECLILRPPIARSGFKLNSTCGGPSATAIEKWS